MFTTDRRPAALVIVVVTRGGNGAVLKDLIYI